jgi:hypothetical protein
MDCTPTTGTICEPEATDDLAPGFWPAQPDQAVLQFPEVSEETKRNLQDLFWSLNPASLKRDLAQRLEAFWRLAVRNIPG